MYICSSCGKEIEELDAGFVRCPYCSCRILYKPPLPTARPVKSK